MKPTCLAALLLALAPAGVPAPGGLIRPDDPPALAAFLASGLGALDARAPAQTGEFGRLVGVWDVEQEIRKRDGSWAGTWPGVWAWKFAIDGYAVQDLFCQSGASLPPYMAGFGRDYLLTAIRVFDARSGRWRVAWMANGAGLTPGADFGTFEATLEEGRLVMTSAAASPMGDQRIVFSGFSDHAFLWESEFSSDGGATWQTVMRIRARRREGLAAGR